ncbi:MAG TPA: TetR/AcrR family transcriptional regulator [Pseudonocardiaceae bacterium]|jgi:AcrR family transcriptional regulator
MSDDAGRVKTVRSSDMARRNRSERREQRRAELVNAATEAIRKHGPDVAMDDIATEAGVSKPILYRHFTDKGDLYMAVSEHATQCMRAALLTGIDGDGDPRELLRLMIDTYLTFIEEQPELYRFVVRRSFSDRPVQRDPVTTNNEFIAGALARIFGEKLRSLGMDTGGAETWAHAGVGMVQAAGDWWLERRTLSRQELRDYLLMMVWGALDGILQAGGSPSRPAATP